MEDIIKLIATYGIGTVISGVVIILAVKYVLNQMKITDLKETQYKEELIKNNTSAMNNLSQTINSLNAVVKETKNAQEEQNRIMNNLQVLLIEHDKLGHRILTQVKINSRDFVKDIREVNATLHVIIKQLFNKAQIQEIEREVEKETKKIEQKEKTYETVD